jgi:hypothetical protein
MQEDIKKLFIKSPTFSARRIKHKITVLAGVSATATHKSEINLEEAPAAV